MIKRPYTTINTASTADGKIDSFQRNGASISSPSDWHRVDRLRAQHDAILVGGRTAIEDDPRLTVKSQRLRQLRVASGLAENPMKVAIVTRANFPDWSRFLSTGPARITIFTTALTAPTDIARLRSRSAEVVVVGETRVDLPAAMAYLYECGVRRLLVEGGGTINSELLRAGLVDELYLYIAPMMLTGASAPTLADGEGLAREDAISLTLTEVDRVEGGGVVLHYLVPTRNPDESSETYKPLA